MITLSDGRNITADSSSFVITIPVTTTTTVAPTTGPTTVTPKKPVPGDKGLSGGAIAGIVIGVLAFLLLCAFLAYILVFRKKTKQNPTVDPNSNALELNQAKGHGKIINPLAELPSVAWALNDLSVDAVYSILLLYPLETPVSYFSFHNLENLERKKKTSQLFSRTLT